jgi:hypothetical protein
LQVFFTFSENMMIANMKAKKKSSFELLYSLVPQDIVEMPSDAYKATVLPLNYCGNTMVDAAGVEPATSSV